MEIKTEENVQKYVTKAEFINLLFCGCNLKKIRKKTKNKLVQVRRKT